MRPAGALDKTSRCVSSAIAFTVTGPTSLRLADRPSALQTAHLRRPSPDELARGVSAAEGPLAPGLGKARDDAFRRRSIGIPAGTAQGWLGDGSI